MKRKRMNETKGMNNYLRQRVKSGTAVIILLTVKYSVRDQIPPADQPQLYH